MIDHNAMAPHLAVGFEQQAAAARRRADRIRAEVSPEPAYPEYTRVHLTEPVREALEEAGVACLSGTAFGRYGEGFIRFSYANSLPNIEEALERMRALLAASPAVARV